MSIRKQIRDRVAQILTSYSTDAGVRVYKAMYLPIAPSELPCICVYTDKETVEIYQSAPRVYDRTLYLRIEIIAEANEELEDVLDRISAQVEGIFNEDQHLNDIAEEVEYKGIEMAVDIKGEMVTGSAVMTYEVRYLEDAVASGFLDPHKLVPFETIYLDSRPGGSLPDTPTEKDEISLVSSEGG